MVYKHNSKILNESTDNHNIRCNGKDNERCPMNTNYLANVIYKELRVTEKIIINKYLCLGAELEKVVL